MPTLKEVTDGIKAQANALKAAKDQWKFYGHWFRHRPGTASPKQIWKWFNEGAYNTDESTCLPRMKALASAEWAQEELKLVMSLKAMNTGQWVAFRRWLSNLRPNRDPAREKARKMQYT